MIDWGTMPERRLLIYRRKEVKKKQRNDPQSNVTCAPSKRTKRSIRLATAAERRAAEAERLRLNPALSSASESISESPVELGFAENGRPPTQTPKGYSAQVQKVLIKKKRETYIVGETGI